MNKKHTAFRIVLFFLNRNVFSSVSEAFPHRRRSEHTHGFRRKTKESMIKVNVFSYSFGA